MIGNVQAIDSKLDLLEDFEDALLNFGEDLFKDADIANFILDLNEDQLDRGIRSDGTEIEPEYKPRTKLIKEYKGQPTDRVTLKDTDEWRGDLKVRIAGGEAFIENPNYLTDGLKAKYGDLILGLLSSNVQLVIYRVAPDFVSFTHRYFRG